MLYQVKAGFGGVVTQSAVVDTRVLAVCAVQLLQVLWNQDDVLALGLGLVVFAGYGQVKKCKTAAIISLQCSRFVKVFPF